MNYNIKNILGISFMILAMFSLSINDITYKYFTYDFPVWEAIFFRALSGSIVSIFLVYKSGISSIKTKKPIRHFVRATSAVGCVVLYVYGIKFLQLSENIAISHSAPIIAALLAVPLLSEKLGIHRISAILIGFIGVLIIVKPGTDLFHLKSLIPIGSAIFMAISYLATRSIMSTDSSTSIVFYYSFALLFTSIIFFPADFIFPKNLDLLLALSLGLMGSAGHYFISLAAKNADVAITSPFEYSSFIFVGIMGYIFFSEIPTKSVIIGSIFIIFSGIYIAYRERKLESI
jgi:drug/metabolite transporter (DMT)-like permease